MATKRRLRDLIFTVEHAALLSVACVTFFQDLKFVHKKNPDSFFKDVEAVSQECCGEIFG